MKYKIWPIYLLYLRQSKMSTSGTATQRFSQRSLSEVLSLRSYTGMTSLRLQSCVHSGNDMTFDTIGAGHNILWFDDPQWDTIQLTNTFGYLKVLHLKEVNYDYIDLLLQLGPIPTLEELVIELAPPTADQCQPNTLPSWYSQGIDTIIPWLVGRNSALTRLTLHGFHAYSLQTPNHDLLGKLLNPTHFHRLTHLSLSGFSPAKKSIFWSLIQLKDGEVGKLPLKRITFFLKYCRPDLARKSIQIYNSEGLAAVYALITNTNLRRPLRCDIVLDSRGGDHVAINSISNRGSSWAVNEPTCGGGKPMEFDHRQLDFMTWDEGDISPLHPQLDSPSWSKVIP